MAEAGAAKAREEDNAGESIEGNVQKQISVFEQSTMHACNFCWDNPNTGCFRCQFTGRLPSSSRLGSTMIL